MRTLMIGLAVLCVCAAVTHATPTVITFEDQWPAAFTDDDGVHPEWGWSFIPSPYAGLDWSFLSYEGWTPWLMLVNKQAYPASGYENTINGQLGVATPYASAMSFGGRVFKLHSLRAGAAWQDGLYAYFVGYRAGAVVRSERLAVPWEGTTLSLNFTGIDALEIYPDTTTGTPHGPGEEYDRQVVMDDICVELGGPAPVADAGPDQTVEQSSPDGAAVTLDGSSSTGTEPLTYAWTEGATVLGTGRTLTVTLGPGAHSLVLTVTDAIGASATDGVVVTVQDTTPPEVAIISPPDGAAYFTTGGTAPVQGDVSDLADPEPTLEWLLDGAPWDGSDLVLAELSLGTHTLQLTATDAAGNSASASSTFTVASQPLSCASVKHLILQWARGCPRGDDSFDLQMWLRLPRGYTARQLTGEVIFGLSTPAAQGSDGVLCTVGRNGDWYYRRCHPAPADLALEQVVLNWGRCRPDGDLNLSGTLRRGLFNDGSGRVRLEVTLPVRDGGELTTTVDLRCRVKPNHWEFLATRDGRF